MSFLLVEHSVVKNTFTAFFGERKSRDMNFKTNKKLFLKGLFSLTFIFKKSINLFANNELFDIFDSFFLY